jgi:hypothetical protein
MATTLKIKNETAEERVIGTLKLAPMDTADLSAKELTSRDFSRALEAGHVSFVDVNNPGQDVIRLAGEVLPGLVVMMRDRITTLKGRLEQAQKELRALREAYNKAWKVAESHLVAAQASAAGWPALRRAAKSLLLDTKAEDQAVTDKKKAVADIQALIDASKAEGMPADAEAREAWYAYRKKMEEDLRKAQEALDKVSHEKADPLAADVASVEVAVAAVAGLKKDEAIGREMPPFGP